MNTETQIVDFFKRQFRTLGERKKTDALKKKAIGRNPNLPDHFKVEVETTFNICCNVLGSDVANIMADENGL